MGRPIPVRALRVENEESYISRAVSSDQFQVIQDALREREFSLKEVRSQNVIKIIDTDSREEGIRVELRYLSGRTGGEEILLLHPEVTFHIFFSAEGQDTIAYVSQAGLLLEEYSTDDETIMSDSRFQLIDWDATVILGRREFELQEIQDG